MAPQPQRGWGLGEQWRTDSRKAVGKLVGLGTVGRKGYVSRLEAERTGISDLRS